MKKLFVIILAIPIIGLAQNVVVEFEQIVPTPPNSYNMLDFVGVDFSSHEFADIDGDNDLDVLITGRDVTNNKISKLYTNDGLGNYTESLVNNFDGVSNSAVAFEDIDGDNDNDLMITGYTSSNSPIAKLYTNDGLGGFTEVIGTPFTEVFNSSIAFADIDGDNDKDVIITGMDANINSISKLYTNDGLGNFAEVIGTPFVGGIVSFADVDGDNDQDVLITGDITKLYINDGLGSFAELVGTPFVGVGYSSTAFADIDGDNDQDVLITGQLGFPSYGMTAKLYVNDGLGSFAELVGTPFVGVGYSSTAFADIDGDDDLDVLITGRSGMTGLTKLYVNDGLGNFSLANNTVFVDLKSGDIDFADVDGDNDLDVLLTGNYFEFGQGITKLYINDSLGNYLEGVDSPFNGVYRSSIAFVDIDNDNDQDVLISGGTSSIGAKTELYTNDGIGNYTISNNIFEGADKSSISFADINGDNDQDVLITGSSTSKLYENNGLGNYTLISNTPFIGIENGSIAFTDIDSDSDQDVLISGNSSSGIITKLYTNDGFGGYNEVTGTPFFAVNYSAIAFADVDGDNDQDVLITGIDPNNNKICKLYTNDGFGNYTGVNNTPFIGFGYSTIAFTDVDGDNDQDVLIAGWNANDIETTKLYTNDGLGNFTEVLGTSFDGAYQGSVAFADVDSDNDQDVLITGWNADDIEIAKLYLNDGIGNYTEILNTPFKGVHLSSIAFSDIDGDNDQDVMITGSKDNEEVTYLYRNITTINMGCTDSLACNYDTTANISDSSCTYPATVTIMQNGIDLEVTSASSYLWNTTETTQNITPTVNGWYWCIVTDVNGCESDTAFYEVTNIVSSIKNVLADKIMIYPNPTINKVTISFTANQLSDYTVSVLNLLGERVFVDRLHQFEGVYLKTVDLSAYSKAVYLLEIETNSGVMNKKLILQ